MVEVVTKQSLDATNAGVAALAAAMGQGLAATTAIANTASSNVASAIEKSDDAIELSTEASALSGEALTTANAASVAVEAVVDAVIPPTIITGALPDPHSQAMFALQDAFEVQPELGALAAYERYVADLIDNGAWQAHDVLLFLNAHSLQAQLINAVNPGESIEVFGSPVRTPFTGVTGAASSALYMPFTPFKAGLNNYQLSCWVVNPGTTTSGMDVYGGTSRVQAGSPVSQVSFRANSGDSLSVLGVRTTDSLLCAVRRDSANQLGFKNGVQIGTDAEVSTTLANIFTVGATNKTGSFFSDGTRAIAASSQALSDEQQASFYAATKRFVETMRTFA